MTSACPLLKGPMSRNEKLQFASDSGLERNNKIFAQSPRADSQRIRLDELEGRNISSDDLRARNKTWSQWNAASWWVEETSGWLTLQKMQLSSFLWCEVMVAVEVEDCPQTCSVQGVSACPQGA